MLAVASLSLQNAKAYIDAADAVENISASNSAITLPTTAWQARPLGQVPPEDYSPNFVEGEFSEVHIQDPG
jgi:hypothetical protein